MAPQWLRVLAWAYLIAAIICGVWIAIDEIVHRSQKMWIMYLVWPITALYAGPAALWGYYRTKEPAAPSADQPTRRQVALAVSHCGAGCTLGDIIGELWASAAALTFAGGAFLTRNLVDFVLAWLIGIVFQYFSIVPMRGLSPGKGIVAAVRADTLSIIAFQAGMFVWMALVHFAFFGGRPLRPNEAVFWFMMQIAMCIGFFTSYPANVFLLKAGWKEKMS